MDAIDKRDVTDRATSGGWVLPDGWTVNVDMSPDHEIGDPARQFDCYSAAQVEAWRNDEWSFVMLSVWVEDPSGREWGREVLGGVECGTFTMTDDDGNVTGTVDIDPLDDKPGEYSPVREHDMIGEALRNAVLELENFGTPRIVEPEGTTMTGL